MWIMINIFTHKDKSTAVSIMRTVTIPLSLFLSHFFYSSSLFPATWVAGVVGGCHGDRFLIRSPRAASSIQKKNSPHRSPWQHTSSGALVLPETLVPLSSFPLWLGSTAVLPFSVAHLLTTWFPVSPRSLMSVCALCLPGCALESSLGPGRQSCPLRCGTLLWSLRRWCCCLDWASTGGTSPTNT